MIRYPFGDYRLWAVRAVDIPDLHAAIFARFGREEQYLRVLDLAEVDQLAEDGALWAAYDEASAPVATAYVKVGITSPESCPTAEFGGVYVHPGHRGVGLAWALACLAVGRYLLDNEDPSSSDELTALVAHVHVGNQAPRKILSKLGFVASQQVRVPADVAGFQFMPRSDLGDILGDEFDLPQRARGKLLMSLAELVEANAWTQPDATELRHIAAAYE